MAKITQNGAVQVTAGFTLDEREMRALRALVDYGDKDILASLQKGLGEGIVRDNRDGFLSLFAAVRDHVGPILSRADAAREAFKVG